MEPVVVLFHTVITSLGEDGAGCSIVCLAL